MPPSDGTASDGTASDGTASDGTADARTRLLMAAGAVFASRGFNRATVREICGEANVNIASVGYYFGDKLGLYREVIETVRRSREHAFPVPEHSGDEPRYDLFRLVNTLLSRILAKDDGGWETELFLREMQNPTSVFRELVNEFFRPLFDRIRNAVEAIIGQPVPQHVIDQLALSAVGQCLYYRVSSGVVHLLIPADQREQHYDVSSLSHHITAVILASADQAALLKHKRKLTELIESHATSIHDKP
ncbi:putative DNA-binding transcriptional regulator [Novipirellula galeiformis]|uniref:Putative DNA-binding transcriptional regulator n=2 Tax=Novipirellula galeiformis TaxID=2528004 RepID=A0A5C6CCG0_9BACT|nr:putative DNA-binding transcriptional regulator [Novipirellula galeiformis]